jgi:hypothetical protein
MIVFIEDEDKGSCCMNTNCGNENEKANLRADVVEQVLTQAACSAHYSEAGQPRDEQNQPGFAN